MASYLDSSGFGLLTVAPPEHVQEVEARQPGWTANQVAAWSSWLDAQLFKRYGVPFVEPVPSIVKLWIAQIVTLELYKRRGVDPSDPEMTLIAQAADRARDDIAKAADAENGLFDLPLRELAGPGQSGIRRGGPLSYSEQSPYAWTDLQSGIGRIEDGNRRGGR